MADERRKGLPVGAWIAIGCLGLITLACGALYVGFKPLFQAGMEMKQEMETAHATPVEEAERLADLSLTLERALDDPESARGKWAILEGVVGEMPEEQQKSFAGNQKGNGFVLGETSDSETRIVMVISESGVAPATGSRVRVLGFFLTADPVAAMMGIMEMMIPEEERASFSEDAGFSILFLAAVEVEVL